MLDLRKHNTKMKPRIKDSFLYNIHCKFNIHIMYAFCPMYNSCSKEYVILLLCTLFVTMLCRIAVIYDLCVNIYNNDVCTYFKDVFKLYYPCHIAHIWTTHIFCLMFRCNKCYMLENLLTTGCDMSKIINTLNHFLDS